MGYLSAAERRGPYPRGTALARRNLTGTPNAHHVPRSVPGCENINLRCADPSPRGLALAPPPPPPGSLRLADAAPPTRAHTRDSLVRGWPAVGGKGQGKKSGCGRAAGPVRRQDVPWGTRWAAAVPHLLAPIPSSKDCPHSLRLRAHLKGWPGSQHHPRQPDPWGRRPHDGDQEGQSPSSTQQGGRSALQAPHWLQPTRAGGGLQPSARPPQEPRWAGRIASGGRWA